jgi:hypothetical protein
MAETLLSPSAVAPSDLAVVKSDLTVAILKTLSYADVFQFPLKAEEVFAYLIAPRSFSAAAVTQALSHLSQQKIIGQAAGFYFLPGREALVAIRQRRTVASRAKWQKADYWSRFFKVCPWIKLVGVSGALAMDNSEANDDLDLVFITARRRLWLTRALVVLFLFLTGQYRRPSRISGRFCPNLFLAEDALSAFEKNLFIAHEIVQLRLLWEREGFYHYFLSRNDWVREYLPHTAPRVFVPTQSDLAATEGKHRSWLASFGDFWEGVAGRLQRRVMARKRTSEVIRDDLLRFHPRETTRLVLTAYEQTLKRLGLPL